MLVKSKFSIFLTSILLGVLGFYSNVNAVAVHTDLNPNPNDLDFGDVDVDDTKKKTVTLTNDNAIDDVVITGVDIDGDNKFDIDTNSCVTTLSPAGTCQIKVAYEPSRVEDNDAELQVTISGDATPLVIDLAGSGVDPDSSINADVTISDNSLDFEDTMVDYVSVQSFNITNSGTTNFTIEDIGLIGTDDEQFEVDDRGCLDVTLSSKKSCTVLVFFEPDLIGNMTAEVEILIKDDNDEIIVDLDGTAITESTVVSVSPIRKDFGEVEKGDTGSVKFTVAVTDNSVGMDVSLTGSSDFDIDRDQCDGENIGTGEDKAECEITVDFTASKGGLISAILKIEAGNEDFFIPLYAFVEGAVGYPSDISGDTFEAYIKRLIDANVVSGFSDDTFRPGESVTRGQLAKFIFNAFNITQNTSCTLFPDVDSTHTFYTHITSLKCAEIIAGFTDGNYKPDDTVTRGEVTKFITRAMENKGVNIDLTKTEDFPDVDETDKFVIYISYLSSVLFEGQNVINGYSDGEFKSSTTLTRGQMSKMVDIAMRYYLSL